MKQYYIEHAIQTLAELFDREGREVRGFLIKPWDFTFADGPIGGALIASRTLEANTPDDAINRFREELSPVVDRLAFVTQCYAEYVLASFIIRKLTENDENVFFLRYANEQPGVPLHFDKEEREAFELLEGYDEPGDVFRYLREAANATTFYSRLAMLVSALEAMAGEREDPKGRRQTNRSYIRGEILQDRDLYDNLFGYGTGIRNKLFHGGKVDLAGEQHEGVDYIDRIYQAILRYFREKYGVRLSTTIVHPMRTPTGNHELWQGWVKPNSQEAKLDIKTVWELFRADQDGTSSASSPNFYKTYEILGHSDAHED